MKPPVQYEMIQEEEDGSYWMKSDRCLIHMTPTDLEKIRVWQISENLPGGSVSPPRDPARVRSLTNANLSG